MQDIIIRISLPDDHPWITEEPGVLDVSDDQAEVEVVREQYHPASIAAVFSTTVAGTPLT